ncbi:MAG TPA: hypothetical protein VNW28_05610 [Chthoniobacterales bacterium]|nr:hypothetical protein [Chthoniobacterales bacterium]
MLNFGYHCARWAGGLRRTAYRALLPAIGQTTVCSPRSIPLDVYSYSGEAMMPEQVRSIRSFLRHAGRPQSFTVVSDGTHSERSRELLSKIDPSVAIRRAEEYRPSDLPEKFRRYVTDHPLGKQLGLIMSLPCSGPALYLDADILFFAGAAEIARASRGENAPAFYLKDCLDYSVDSRILRGRDESSPPVNAGLLLLLRRLDWSLGIQRLIELEGAADFFTTQTIVQLVMHANGALPFDEQKYVLRLDDQFVYADRYAGSHLVLRHYVNPVRHKFWNAVSPR